jgi:dihydroxyacetone kinase phosphotransfer subunit
VRARPHWLLLLYAIFWEIDIVPNVGIVIVSHSAKIAEGTADMVHQMVGDSVPVAHTGGNADGGLGTDVGAIMKAIDRAWSEAGIVILVDLGGAETNSEMAIEMLDADRRHKVVLCDAPLVEGAIIAAAEASGGASVDQVKSMAEDIHRQ